MSEKEIWKDVVGYDGSYKISNYGHVISCKYNATREIKGYINNKGYYVVDLYLNNKRKKILVHHLVAECFVANNYNKTYVDHIDGNPMNNHASNLRWCTHKENCNFPIAIERKRIAQKEIHSRKEWREKKSLSTQKQMNDPINKLKHSLKMKMKWMEDDFIRKQRERPSINKPVLQYSKSGCFISEYISLNEAQRKTKIDSSSIARCCKGKQKSAGGFCWKFKN